jgi:hypothetical protein
MREAAETFASKLFPRTPRLLRTEPLKALVIGAFVRGLSMRDVESLAEKAGLGKLPKSTVAKICQELRDRFEAFKRCDLHGIRLVALFLDATYRKGRPEGPKERVLVAWGFTEEGQRVLPAVMLGMREAYQDWLALGRDLIARAGRADADRRRRRARAGQGRRAVLAIVGASALLGSPPAESVGDAARARARPPNLLAGARRRDQPATANNDYRA